MKIQEIMQRIEGFAPLGLGLNWDNVGLLLGQRDWEVSKVYITLDVTQTAVEAAIKAGCQLILSHHPLIFRALKGITDPILIRLIQAQVAVISLHTNLDVAENGVNHALARQLGLEVLSVFSEETGATYHHISVYCPTGYEDRICQAAWEAGAGKTGNYHNCGTRHAVQGYFEAGEGARPFVTKPQNGYVEETELEFNCDSFRLNGVIKAIQAAHPYQTPALQHYPIANSNPAYGLGLVCSIDGDLSLQQVAALVKERLACPHTKLWTAGMALDSPVRRIAICGGSGGSLVASIASKADVFISGDITYHTFLDSHIPLIDAGHFYTEYPALQLLGGFVSTLGLEAQLMPAAEHEYGRYLQMV